MPNSIFVVALLIALLCPSTKARAWGLAGGAKDASEMAELNLLAQNSDFQNKCPLKDLITKVKGDPAVTELVGRNILFWETNCDSQQIVAWNKEETFASIGLPHVVWFPPGMNSDLVVDESFPQMWSFLKKKYQTSDRGNAVFPNWVDPKKFPWANRAAFLSDRSDRMKELVAFLNHPTALKWQAEYAIERGMASGYKILAASALETGGAPSGIVCQNLQKLMKTGPGVLAITDFSNFKGEGISPIEIRTDQNDASGKRKIRWGLKQVLERMGSLDQAAIDKRIPMKVPARADRDRARLAFSAAVLENLEGVANAFVGKERLNRQNYLRKDGKGGWYNRVISTYAGDGIPASKCRLYPSSGATTTGLSGAIQ